MGPPSITHLFHLPLVPLQDVIVTPGHSLYTPLASQSWSQVGSNSSLWAPLLGEKGACVPLRGWPGGNAGVCPQPLPLGPFKIPQIRPLPRTRTVPGWERSSCPRAAWGRCPLRPGLAAPPSPFNAALGRVFLTGSSDPVAPLAPQGLWDKGEREKPGLETQGHLDAGSADPSHRLPLDQPGFWQEEFTLGGSSKKTLLRKEWLARVGMGGNAQGSGRQRDKQWQSLPPGLGGWAGKGGNSVTQPRRAGAGKRSQQQGCGHKGTQCCRDTAFPSSRPSPVGASHWPNPAGSQRPGHREKPTEIRAERGTNGKLPAHSQPPTCSLASGPLRLPGPCWAHRSVLSTWLTPVSSVSFPAPFLHPTSVLPTRHQDSAPSSSKAAGLLNH
uniref:hyaluronan and proteoglycan link protein 3 isoform X1 n=1 Tax=Halichoerus grypus TaxID=9711 RepID=UPI0016590CA5|nr:hyaluronan and proteoglycan link protein 3 isoform X1 [Halichoerus grypus]